MKKKWLIQSFCIYCYIIINVAQVFITAYQYIFEADIFILHQACVQMAYHSKLIYYRLTWRLHAYYLL